MSDSTVLSYEVLVLDGVTRVSEQRMPNGDPFVSSPVACTLIHGERDAVLVDPPFTHQQIQEVGDWIERSGKRLAHIYITHGHGDHWFGTGELVKRFRGVRVHATRGTIGLMHEAAKGRAQWDAFFPGQIPKTPVLAEPVPAEGFLLEGHVLRAVEVGHTDTDATTVLHVPSIGLVVAGDAVYNGVHQMLLESANGGLEKWLEALDTIEALNPRAVVASHKNRELPDDPAILGETRQYLLDAARLLKTSANAGEYYDAMLSLYPDRLNKGPLWYGAVGLLGR
ncbi:MBL fold hydrolase [Streptomyces antioxidans]|uniref:MBL fold hydrolase n=1 Tax=Streptomyces antioxidans TaxID=1507734 RepID=A0A1V4D3V8_9ACTN|nr:MBL fold metallo-hydrolase [Streptomyces antioxidans]OPF78849.1 MBL fold hydrolase [Streptomyces antioxidans]